MADESRAASDAITQRLSGGRFAVACILAFGIPLLLCASLVMLLRHDTDVRRSANDALIAQIRKIDAQIADVKDLAKVKSGMLARKQIVEVLLAYSGREAVVLDVFGHMSDGVQLLALDMDAERTVFDLRSTSAGELGVLELLAQHGLGNLRVTARHQEQDAAFERVTIEARPSRRGEE